VSSGFRCEGHNRAVGGVSTSNHRRGTAVDIHISGVTHAEIVRVARAAGAAGDTYVGATFAHIAVSAAIPAPAQVINPHPVPTRNLSQGSTGNDVRWLQFSLNAVNNAGLTVDGIFGARTAEAVRNFQRQNGLAADGIVGPLTRNALLNRLR
jgi:peptidoglycan hydrolase-like protein with peptidoglycan-binding domain